ncbi:MAG TPA: dihydrolipoamide acetyltransferase family protein [Nitriliruptorales bacterium]|nr:dihydrolipoamide acetyltransferase family protein [Nitriliruptorales bacterium]
MAEEVKLPQLGESVTEGTITAWLVKEGEHVEEDQPLFEISTEKVDTEVPSPASGVLKQIRAEVDDTIEVGAVVALIDTDGAAAEEAAEEAPTETEEEPEEEPAEAAPAEAEEQAAAETEEQAPAAETEEQAPAAEDEEQAPRRAAAEQRAEPEGDGRAKGELLSPIVRRLVNEHDLDPSRIEGTGKGGRITREDVERAIEEGGARRRAEEEPAAAAPEEKPAAAQAGVEPRKPHEGVRGHTEKLSRVRAAIARSMWRSLQSTAQLTAAREVDVTGIMQAREGVKDAFRQREGVPLSPLPFIARGVCLVLPRHEALNASIDVEGGVAKYYDTINLGFAVDAPQGLIVPNLKDAQDLTVPALARSIADLADRVRNKRISPDDVQGGTFTITNTGSRGVLFDTPVLNPPETGILATPTIEKRPVVVSQDGADAIAIRWMTYLCLTYDHRMVDGADAARFLADLKEIVETHDWTTEVGAYR